MAHERTYDEDEPYLEPVRHVCLALPEAVEVEAWGRPTFRAGRKLFAIYSGTGQRQCGLVFKPEEDERLALLEDSRFYSPRYWGPSGWLALDLDAAPVDWVEVTELVTSSYRQVALKRMLKALDSP